MTYTTNYINFVFFWSCWRLTIKKTSVLEKDTVSLPNSFTLTCKSSFHDNLDRNVITRWAMTNHMLFHLYYTTGARFNTTCFLFSKSSWIISSNTVSGRWWVGCYIWYSEEGPGWAGAPPSPLLTVPTVTAHPPVNGQFTNFILFDVGTWHYNCLWTLKS